MSPNKQSLFTVGYEGREQEEFVESLRRAGVKRIIDVRIRAGSRKRGFSKTAMQERLAQDGIDYVHLRDLGTPLEMLKKVRATGVYDWDGYRDHMLQQTDALSAAEALVLEKQSALLCYEADANDCHRWIIADHLSERLDLDVQHLCAELV